MARSMLEANVGSLRGRSSHIVDANSRDRGRDVCVPFDACVMEICDLDI